jgi:GT2 family glycosyltransferase
MIDLASTEEYATEYQPIRACRGSDNSCHSDITVIVTAHNSAAYLRECVESILGQTLAPEKIIVVDDFSTLDNTLAIAHAFEQHGVLVLRTPKNLGMCEARMFGLEHTNSPFILFFDGDDIMPSTCLEVMRREIGNHGFVYPGRQFFGSRTTLIKAPVADRGALWRQNYCPSPSLMRRHVFEAAGGWQKANTEGTLPDWNLFLRMSRISSFCASSIDILVRKHDSNFSGQQFPRPISEIYADTRVHAATVTVGMVYSGRLGERFLHQSLAHISNSLHQAGKTAELFIQDDSPDGMGAILKTGPVFHSVRVERIHRKRDQKLTAHNVSRLLARSYNRIKRQSSGDLLWLVEDDMIVPSNAAKDLMSAILCSQSAPIPAACGCYKSRHNPDRFVLSFFDGRSVVHTKNMPVKPSPVQLTGTGCLMMLRDLVEDVEFDPMWRNNGVVSNAHDWTFSSKLFDQGRPVIALPSIYCPHFGSESAFV